MNKFIKFAVMFYICMGKAVSSEQFFVLENVLKPKKVIDVSPGTCRFMYDKSAKITNAVINVCSNDCKYTSGTTKLLAVEHAHVIDSKIIVSGNAKFSCLMGLTLENSSIELIENNGWRPSFLVDGTLKLVGNCYINTGNMKIEISKQLLNNEEAYLDITELNNLIGNNISFYSSFYSGSRILLKYYKDNSLSQQEFNKEKKQLGININSNGKIKFMIDNPNNLIEKIRTMLLNFLCGVPKTVKPRVKLHGIIVKDQRFLVGDYDSFLQIDFLTKKPFALLKKKNTEVKRIFVIGSEEELTRLFEISGAKALIAK